MKIFRIVPIFFIASYFTASCVNNRVLETEKPTVVANVATSNYLLIHNDTIPVDRLTFNLRPPTGSDITDNIDAWANL